MNGVTDEVAHYKPHGAPSPIAGQLAHIVTGIDFFLLGMAAGQQPLMVGEFATNYTRQKRTLKEK